jgi:prephenate dehydrogenase
MRDLTIGIIGGTGGMGQWLKGFFEGSGYQVLVASRRTRLRPLELCKNSDVVVLSVPMNVVEEIAIEIGPHVKKESLLLDVTSLKVKPLEVMLKHSSSSVVGTHPLFGPDTKSIENHTVVLCRGRGDKWFAWLSNLLDKKGAKTKITTPEEHDRMMAIVQGLTHLSTIVLAHTMMNLNARISETLDYATPVYESKLRTIRRLFTQNLGLYRDIELLNPYVSDVATAFLHSVEETVGMIKNGDVKGFEQCLQVVGDFVGGLGLE